jgi:hypothetical protein
MPKYYDNWKQESITCKKCGWQGLGDTCERGEFFEALFELCCPKCGETLQMVSLPTIQESEANWDALSEADKLVVNAVEEGQAAFLARLLKKADQLPDIASDSFKLVWDVEGSGLKEETLISFGRRCIWREPSSYENFQRFIEIAAILKKKYGRRLTDLVPTRQSKLSLYGDRLNALHLVDTARKKLAGRKRSRSTR